MMIDRDGGYTPTPVLSHAILTYNRGRKTRLLTALLSLLHIIHKRIGGFKYNPSHGGPAETHVTKWIEERANALLAENLRGVSRTPYERAHQAATTHRYNYNDAYISDLSNVIDMEAIRAATLKIAVDPL